MKAPPDIEKHLKSMTAKELAELVSKTRILERRLAESGPRDDDELHSWILNNLGINIPRVAACDGHQAPFDFLADLFFERTQSALLMANRGGSKTFLVALLHLINSLFKPGVESATVGAIEMQARRAYMHLQKLLEKHGSDQIAAAIMSETRFKNGSRVEILPGTISAVNGPHPHKVHADEVELMDPEVFDESRNMSQGGRINGEYVKAQDIITSTRKRGHGPMQKLLDEINEAELDGKEPPYKLYQWCCFESAARVDNCQCAYPEIENHCPCDDVVKGRWENGQPRTLKDVCRGRMAKSDGWVPLNDVINTFTKTSKGIWEAQQECIKPSLAGLVVQGFTRESCAIQDYEPNPDLGPIYMSVDFGGTNPHAVNWYQLLREEVEVKDYRGGTKRLTQGSIVCFDEVYKAEIGNVKLAELVAKKEARWRKAYRGWRVNKRFADPAAKAARLDWAKHDPPLPTVYRVTREIVEHIKLVVNLIEDEKLFVDAGRCPMWIEEIEAWHYPQKRADMEYDPEIPVDDFNHCMSNLRYAVANIASIEYTVGKYNGMPATKSRREIQEGTAQANINDLPIAVGAGRSNNKTESWRLRLGGPFQQ